MKRLFRKTTAAAVSALLLTQIMPVAEMSATAPDKNKLTIHPYVLSQDQYNTAKTNGATGTTTDYTTYIDNKGYISGEGINFDITQVDENGTPIQSGVSGHNVKTLDDMPDGFYLIDPLDNSTDSAFGASDAFIIQLPVPKAGGGVNRDVHIYPKLLNNEEGNNNTPGNDDVPAAGDTHYVELTKYDSKAKDADGVLNTTLAGAKFNVYYKDAAGNMVSAASGGNKKEYTTDSTGKFTITGLPLGDYYFVEQTAPAGYLLDQTPTKFIIDGSNHAAINFLNDKKLTVSSESAGDATGDHSYNWTITADVPKNTSNLISYVITGSYTDLDPNNIIIGIDAAALNGKYTVTKDDNAKTFTITINDMSALAGLDTLEFKVTSQIASGQTSATINASIEYKYAYTPKNTDPAISDIPNPGANYPTAETQSQAAPASLTLATFKIKNVSSTDNTTELDDGEYKITIGDNTTVTLTDDGSTKLASIVNYAPGKYKVEQNKTESGYLINDTARTIFITADGKMYEDTNSNDTLDTTGQNPDRDITSDGLVFINQKTNNNFALPFTGTTATRVFTVTGICVMLAAGGFIFMILRKKDEDEDGNNG